MRIRDDFAAEDSSEMESNYPSLQPGSLSSVLWTEKVYQNLAEDHRKFQKQWLESKRDADNSMHFPGIEKLYKYRSIDPVHPERTTKIFEEQTLWCPSIVNLNDPLESAFSMGQDVHPAMGEAIKMMASSKWWGCISLTADPICPQMWAHYAASHSGFCIKYRRLDSFLLCNVWCRPLMYRRDPPALEDGIEAQTPNMNQVFYTKSENWEYEREWRLQYPNADSYLPSGLLVPSAVIFGLRTSEASKQILKKCAQHLDFGQIVTYGEPYRLKIKWEETKNE